MSLCHHSTPTPEREPSKTALYCPTCNHESQADGDWVGDDATERHRLLCPRCGDVVLDQPTF